MSMQPDRVQNVCTNKQAFLITLLFCCTLSAVDQDVAAGLHCAQSFDPSLKLAGRQMLQKVVHKDRADSGVGAGLSSAARVVDMDAGAVPIPENGTKAVQVVDLGHHSSKHPLQAFIYFLIPTAFVAACMGLLVLSLGNAIASDTAAGAARSVALMVQFSGFTSYSVAILCSYELATTIGQDLAYSGSFIGCFMFGTGIGMVVSWLLLQVWPDIWRDHPRSILTVGLLSQVLGSLMFIGSAWATQWNEEDQKHLHLPSLFILTRVIAGIGVGLCLQSQQVAFAHLTPAEERPSQMVRWVFTNMIGVGAGPILAAGVEKLQFIDTASARFVTVGLAQLVMATFTLGAARTLYPSLESVTDFMKCPVVNDSKSGDQKCHVWRAVGLAGCMILTAIRAYTVSGVEAATILLLEKDYGWSRSCVGVCCALPFLSGIPLKYLRDHSPVKVTLEFWVRLCAVIACIGTLLLFPVACRIPTAIQGLLMSRAQCSGLVLIAADFLIFPFINMSGAICLGVMQQLVLPSGSLFDLNRTTLFAGLLQNGIARYLGPWGSRWVIQWGSQSKYAWHQLSMSIAFFLVFELMVRRAMRKANA